MVQKNNLKGNMTSNPFCLDPKVKIKDALDFMRSWGIRHLPVTDPEDQVLGVVSERDILRMISMKSVDVEVSEVMTINPVTFRFDAPIGQVIEAMRDKKIGSVLVTNKENKIAGVFTTVDAMDLLIKMLRSDEERERALHHFFTPQMEFATNA